jgi:heme/copper-type cytochrome/quinol oxidase subunit 3
METPSTAAPALSGPAFPFTNGKLGMWLFLASDGMGFLGLIMAYMVLRIAAPDWQVVGRDPGFGIGLTAFMTFVLILSSVTMVTALAAIKRGEPKKMLFWLAATAAGGATFLGLQVYEWTHLIHEGLIASKSNYAATFFLLTGFHGLHVTIGVIYLSVIWVRGKMGAFSAQSHSPVELAGLYWHFVDLVWIVLFTIIYLIPDSVT